MAVGDINSKIKEAKFIGVTGFAQVGKDETTKILQELGFTRVSLADKVRQGIYNINPWVMILPNEPNYNKLNQQYINSVNNSNLIIRLKDIVDFLGWDESKKIAEVRRLLQYYGTEGAREIFGDTIWTDTADKYINNSNIHKVAVSDVRFTNELAWIRSKKDNLIIKVTRPGIGSINSHSSDLGIPDEMCDIVINNNGSIEDLRKKII